MLPNNLENSEPEDLDLDDHILDVEEMFDELNQHQLDSDLEEDEIDLNDGNDQLTFEEENLQLDEDEFDIDHEEIDVELEPSNEHEPLQIDGFDENDFNQRASRASNKSVRRNRNRVNLGDPEAGSKMKKDYENQKRRQRNRVNLGDPQASDKIKKDYEKGIDI